MPHISLRLEGDGSLLDGHGGLLRLEDDGGLLLVLGEGPGLVGDGGEGHALTGRRADEAGVGGDGDHPQRVPGGEYGQGPALDLS